MKNKKILNVALPTKYSDNKSFRELEIEISPLERKQLYEQSELKLQERVEENEKSTLSCLSGTLPQRRVKALSQTICHYEDERSEDEVIQTNIFGLPRKIEDFSRNDRKTAFSSTENLIDRHSERNRFFTNKGSRMTKKCAFTLSEVLITLSILGIIAVLTIPNLINSYNERVTVVKVKKMYNMLDTAYQTYLVENNGIAPDFEFSKEGAEKLYEEIIAPNFQVNYAAGTDISKKAKIIYNGSYQNINNVTTDTATHWNSDKFYAVKLKDGGVLDFRGNVGAVEGVQKYTIKAYLFYDVNGKRGPNVIGKDYFTFGLGSNPGREIILGNSDASITYLADKCKNNMYGFTCAAYIIKYGNMDYLKNINSQ